MKNKFLNVMLFSAISLIALRANAQVESYTITPRFDAGSRAQYCIGTEDCYSIPYRQVLNVYPKSDVTFMWQNYFEYKLSSNKDSESTQLLYLNYDNNSTEYQVNLKDFLADCGWEQDVCKSSLSSNPTNNTIINTFWVSRKMVATKKDSTKAK